VEKNEGIPQVAQGGSEDPFPAFNPENDVVVGQFVALIVDLSEIREGVPFYVGKVLEFGQGRRASKMKVLWYWPTMRPQVHEDVGSNRVRYTNCMEVTWELSGERLSWVDKEVSICSRMDVPLRRRSGHVIHSNMTVHGVQTEEKVLIPQEAKPNLVEYMAIQMEDLDNKRLRNNLDRY